MDKFIFLVLLMPIMIVSLLFAKYVFYAKIFQKLKRPIFFIMVVLLFITHQYFIVSFAMNNVGFVCYQYVLAIAAYFINKKYGIVMLFLSAFTVNIYLSINDSTNFGRLLLALTISAGVLLFVSIIEKISKKHTLVGYAFINVFVNTSIPWIFATMYPERAYSFSDMFFVALGSCLINIFIGLYMRSDEAEKRKLAQIERRESHDKLTGLYNYNAYSRFIEKLKFEPQGDWLTVMIDLDHFKLVNDTYGHLDGNEALKFFARSLYNFVKKNFAAETWLFRFGGEEFCLLIKNYSAERCFEKMDEFQEALHQRPFLTKSGQTLILSFSAGLASTKDSEQDILLMIRNADAALYIAKKSGKGRIVCPDCHF
ncbi:Signal transduction diguanylate cyclase [Liquorilactobacillus sucicola DSM 21376 = JCM 15457]|uniref:Signal transduction diguanylate cyclase n=1 Tax=Liquorilactobacillus sucicola DSM 21376 = JCM 15457 TaxID=1423806 RepID=A0A0R2DRE7_9LACO|nr:GGDEF domain-containing protein [Liquorilactobacillus sucicola]KRN06608.1 Signal transduction diguanylate cyclase [Liquorilactobacillus sucicola DSM 21376 = JCM 15457]